MKGLILSGGKGTRLRPITHTSAKQLVPIANKPVLFYGVEAIRNAGITDIGVIVGDTKDEIKEALGDGATFDVKITYIEQSAPLGLAHAVLTAEEYLGDSSFVMYLGDNMILSGISELVREFEKNRPNSQVLLAHVKNPNQFGVAELEDGRVKKLVEKPANPKSDLALVGVYMFDKNIFKATKSIKPSQRGELEITDAIQWLLDNGFSVEPHIVSGWWKDTGKLDDMLEANRMVLDGIDETVEGIVDEKSAVHFKVKIEKGAQIINSTLRGPLVIGKNTKIINSYVGPFTSISDNCVIENSEIEHSIILSNSIISHIETRIEDSLIGKDVEVTKSSSKPKALRLMLGDHSKIGL